MATPPSTRTREVRRLPASRWPAELSEEQDLSLEAADEPLSMHHVIHAMTHVWGVAEVDLSGLARYEQPKQQTTARRFFLGAAVFWEDLERLRVGAACLSMDNGPDARGKWDVDYLVEAIPAFKSLRALELPGLVLEAAEGCDILAACGRNPSITALDLSDNNLHELDRVLLEENIVCGLRRLDLSRNALGEFDEDSLGCELTCNALGCLLGRYTSITHLDLSENSMNAPEGRAIADALRTGTHLRSLRLPGNYWDADVDAAIRDAWQGTADGLVL